MDKLVTYDEFLNENLLDEINKKIDSLWNNFQFRDNLFRKLYRLTTTGGWVLLMTFLSIVAYRYFSHLPSNNLWPVAFALLGYAVTTIHKKLTKEKIDHIKLKVKEISSNMNEYLYKNEIFIVLGDTKDIKAYIEKLKYFGIIDDSHILDYKDIFLIDFSGQYEKEKPMIGHHDDIDPYDEEDWIDRPVMYDVLEWSLFMKNKANKLTKEYGVRLRPIKDAECIWDDSMKFKKIEHDEVLKIDLARKKRSDAKKLRKLEKLRKKHKNDYDEYDRFGVKKFI